MFHGESHYGQEIVEPRAETSWYHRSVTFVLLPRISEEHLSACNSWGSAEEPPGRGRWNEEKESQKKTTGDRRSATAFKSLAGPITVGRSSAILPGRPQLLHLTLVPFPFLDSVMAIAEGLRKFGDCRAKTDHFKAAYLTLAKFFITVA